jgi:hypothetical protein
MRRLWNIRQVAGEDENTDEEEQEMSSDEEEEILGEEEEEALEDHVLAFLISLLDDTLKNNEYKSVLVSAAAIFGVDGGRGWKNALLYTPTISAVINRIVWFAERYPSQDRVNLVMGRFSGLIEPPSQFPCLAHLNRVWKEGVEAITFHHLTIKSNDLDTPQAVVTGNRLRYLAKISFTVLPPEYSDEACARVESLDEQWRNDEAFAKGIGDYLSP